METIKRLIAVAVRRTKELIRNKDLTVTVRRLNTSASFNFHVAIGVGCGFDRGFSFTKNESGEEVVSPSGLYAQVDLIFFRFYAGYDLYRLIEKLDGK